MIDVFLKNMILPNLKMQISRNDYVYIDEMFSETYLLVEDGVTVVALKPLPTSVSYDVDKSLLFNRINGSCVGIGFWSDIKKKGKRI